MENEQAITNVLTFLVIAFYGGCLMLGGFIGAKLLKKNEVFMDLMVGDIEE